MMGCLNFAALVHQGRREAPLVQERAEAGVTLATNQGATFWLAFGTVLGGWALAERGQQKEGLSQLNQGIETYQATGAKGFQPYLLALLADVYWKNGQTEKGLNVVAEAFTLIDRTGEHFWEAELYRLKGELLLQQEHQKINGKSQQSLISRRKRKEIGRPHRSPA